MLWLLSILAFIVIFSLLILIHEFGHFFAAKKCGVKVEEFGLGMPPRVWGFKPKKSETLYSLNAIPFGGFVRLYGEDSHDKKVLSNEKSFASKPIWKKVLIIVAGVLMNFLLAFVLLTAGLTAGMQPLFVTPEDVYQGIKEGVVKLEEGILVKEKGSNDIGFLPGDKIVAVNEKPVVLGDELFGLKDQEPVTFTVERAGQRLMMKGINNLKEPFFKLYDPLLLPQLVLLNAAQGENYFGNMPAGTVVRAVDGQAVYSVEELEMALKDNQNPQIITVPGRLEVPSQWQEDSFYPVVISTVSSGSNAEKAGLMEGDLIKTINGQPIIRIADLAEAMKVKQIENKAIYKILRGSSEIEFFVNKDENGLIGVMLSEVELMKNYRAAFYSKSVPYSVVKIENVSYPIWEAPGQAFMEMGRLSVLTAGMFVEVFSSLFTRLAVPEGVAGPVGIAQMTFVFVQEGFISLIRFTALLSLSLGIINILPFPGLDGGRFFLILIPALIGKKINPKLEAMIHLFGFLVLMLLIFLVTFNDIARLFG